MEPTAIGGKVASGLLASLLKKVFPADGPGAGLAPNPVRLGARVSLGGEKRQLGERELRRLATRLVEDALATPGEPPFADDERTAVTDALTRRLLALGEIDMDAVQSARLDERELTGRLTAVAKRLDGLSGDAELFLERATGWACAQILEYFSRRSTFVARTVVEQSRAQARTAAGVEELLVRTRRPDTRDRDFETRYLAHLAKKHGRLTIYGIDLTNSPGRWPLDAAYLSLEAVRHDGEPLGPAFGATPAKPVRVPADEALAGHDRVLLRGVAGSGKTTLVQWLAVSAASGATGRMAHLAGRVPFVLPLRTLTRHGEQLPSPTRFLTAVGCPLDGAQPDGWEYRVLASGRAMVLIDGLDEVPERERERARAWLRDLADAFPGNRWLITSRPSAVDDEWLADDGFTELVLSAMSPSDVASFIHRWHGAASTGVPEEDELLASYCAQLLDAVRTKPDLGRLATNPLMCGLICALHRDRRGYLPHGRKELYESALSMLLTRRDRERDMAVPELSEEPQLQLLQRLAYWLIRNGRTELDRDRAESIIAEGLPSVPAASVLGDAPAVLSHFLIRTGLLLTPSPDTLHFVHRTFQDYLGARAAVEAGDFGLLAEHACDDQWSDVIRMAVAQARPRERAELLGLLASNPDKRAHLLAMACLEHATELEPAVRLEIQNLARKLLPPRTVDEAEELALAGPLVLELLPGPDGLSDKEAEAVTATAALVGTDAAIPLLKRYVDHPYPWVRYHLLRAWGRFDPAGYADEVLAQLDAQKFFIRVSSPETLSALHRIALRNRLVFEGPHRLTDIIRALPVGAREINVVDNPLLQDLRPLAALGSLDTVSLAACPGVEDLSALTELELTALHVQGSGGISGLDRLTTLRDLTVPTDLMAGLRDLPRGAQLTGLNLTGNALPTGGLRGLAEWPTLERLQLHCEIKLLDSEDWSELASHPSLTTLVVSAQAARQCGDAPELSNIKTLCIDGVRGDEDLSPLARLCPNLSAVELASSRAVNLDHSAYDQDFPGIAVTSSRPHTVAF
ncbi:NACHT domain-containing protein [Streptomyces sp. BK022]|uniref:NACHT domain-containing protein n=1 Tax=Streptomyces sp. BK022 TaxID=2512123 RepID=UPI0010294ACB|nr:NACHT domain-containing protein [Streptomyces sp. BK022]RZU30332.1 NACHT domain-containing protein [Streptomyces sp. BK022]